MFAFSTAKVLAECLHLRLAIALPGYSEAHLAQPGTTCPLPFLFLPAPVKTRLGCASILWDSVLCFEPYPNSQICLIWNLFNLMMELSLLPGQSYLLNLNPPPFFLLFRATHAAYGSFQARGRIASLCHSHSNVGSAIATYTTAHGNAGFLTHWARPGMEPASSWILVGFVSTVPQWELPT